MLFLLNSNKEIISDLKNIISCKYTVDLDSKENFLDCTISAKGQIIEDTNMILVPRKEDTYYLYKIEDLTETRDSEYTYEIYGEVETLEETLSNLVAPRIFRKTNVLFVLNELLKDTSIKAEITGEIKDVEEFEIEQYCNVRKALIDFLEYAGLEFDIYFRISNSTVTGVLEVSDQLGSREITNLYTDSKILSTKIKTSYQDLYNKYLCQGKNAGIMLRGQATVPKEWVDKGYSIEGDYLINTPSINKYGIKSTFYQDDSSDGQMLCLRALEKMETTIEKKIEYDTNFIEIGDKSLGDTVAIKVSNLNNALFATARIRRIEKDLKGTDTQYTLSNYKRYEIKINDDILALQNQIQNIETEINAQRFALEIQSSNGTSFKNENVSTRLSAVFREGNQVLASRVSYRWFKADGTVFSAEKIVDVNYRHFENNRLYLKCSAVYDYEGVQATLEQEVTLININDGIDGTPGGPPGPQGPAGQDSFSVTILSSGGLVFKNGAGSSTLTAKLFSGNEERDKDGSKYSYEWEKYTDGEKDEWSASGKKIQINQNHVNGSTNFVVKVGTIAQGQVTISDLSDVIASSKEPDNKVIGTLWFNEENGKTYIWTGTKWEIAFANETIGGNNYFRNAAFRDRNYLDLSENATIDNEFLYLDKYNSIKFESRDLTEDKLSFLRNSSSNVKAFPTDVWSGQAKVYIPSDNVNDISSIYAEITFVDSNGYKTLSRRVDADLNLKNVWQHIKIENVKAPDNTFKVYLSCCLTRSGICYFSQPQLERGSVCTDFRESIEDIQEQANEMINTVMDIQQKIEDGKIINTVTSSEELKTLLNQKPNVEDINGMITEDQLNGYLDQQKKYIDDKIGGINMTNYVNKTEFEQSMKDFLFKFEQGGGVNLIRDSIGFSTDHNYWNFNPSLISPTQNPSIEALGFNSGWKFHGTGDWHVLEQNIKLNSNKKHTVSFFLKKEPNVQFRLEIENVDGSNRQDFSTIGSNSYNYDYVYFTFVANSSEIRLKIVEAMVESSNKKSGTIITGLMLNQGEIPMSWQSHPTEIYNSNVKFDINGITVNRMNSDEKVGYTEITPQQFAGYYKNAKTSAMEKVFWLDKDVTYTTKVAAKEEMNVGTLKIVYLKGSGQEGVAFVPLSNPIIPN